MMPARRCAGRGPSGHGLGRRHRPAGPDRHLGVGGPLRGGQALADGRSARRVAIAAATAAFFALTIPWWGRSLLGQPDVPVLAARVVEDAFGIAAVGLVVILARLPAAERASDPEVTVRPRRTMPAA